MPFLAVGFVVLISVPAVALLLGLDPRLTIAGRVLWLLTAFALASVGIVKTGRALLVARRWGWPKSTQSELSNVASTTPGNGDARSLMERVVRLADDQGRHLVLRVDPSNERAVARYRRGGFAKTNRRWPNGQITMERPPVEPSRATVDPTRFVLVACLALAAATIAASGSSALPATAAGASTALLCLAAAVDHSTMRVPNVLVFAAFLLGVVAVDASDAGAIAPAGIAVAASPLLLIHLLDPVALGFGDVKFAGAAGLVVGSIAWPAAVLIPLVGLAGASVARIIGAARARPFAPYLFVATTAAMAFAVWLTSTGGFS